MEIWKIQKRVEKYSSELRKAARDVKSEVFTYVNLHLFSIFSILFSFLFWLAQEAKMSQVHTEFHKQKIRKTKPFIVIFLVGYLT